VNARSNYELNSVVSNIHSAMANVVGDVSQAYTYIFDSVDRTFVYASRPNQELESTILQFDIEKGIDTLVIEADQEYAEVPCPEINSVFYVKPMAENLYFGLCVPDNEVDRAKAIEIMSSNFQQG
jgi:hypothetical protein